MRSEEIPEEEPDEPEEEPTSQGSVATATAPSLGFPSREFEFQAEEVSIADLADGKKLATRLTEASKDGWDFVQVVEAGDKRLLLLRRAKRAERQARQVGFMPPARP